MLSKYKVLLTSIAGCVHKCWCCWLLLLLVYHRLVVEYQLYACAHKCVCVRTCVKVVMDSYMCIIYILHTGLMCTCKFKYILNMSLYTWECILSVWWWEKTYQSTVCYVNVLLLSMKFIYLVTSWPSNFMIYIRTFIQFVYIQALLLWHVYPCAHIHTHNVLFSLLFTVDHQSWKTYSMLKDKMSDVRHLSKTAPSVMQIMLVKD